MTQRDPQAAPRPWPMISVIMLASLSLLLTLLYPHTLLGVGIGFGNGATILIASICGRKSA